MLTGFRRPALPESGIGGVVDGKDGVAERFPAELDGQRGLYGGERLASGLVVSKRNLLG